MKLKDVALSGGQMGVNRGATIPRFRIDDAHLEVEFDTADTDITGAHRESAREDRTWDDIALRNGRFETPSVQRHFFGARHEEAGGVLEHWD